MGLKLDLTFLSFIPDTSHFVPCHQPGQNIRNDCIRKNIWASASLISSPDLVLAVRGQTAKTRSGDEITASHIFGKDNIEVDKDREALRC